MSEGRRGGREARRAVRHSVAVRSLPALQRRLPLYEVLTPEQLDRIHDTAMRVLEEIGIDFREDEALAIWAQGRCRASTAQRVRIPRELLMGLVAKAPERFTLHARDPAKSVEIGGDTHGVRPDLRLALRARLRRRAPLRHDGGPEQPPQAGLHGPRPAEHRLGHLRAGRRRHPQAAPAHHRLGDPPQRQELHGPGHPPRPRRGRGAHVRDRVRQGVRPRQRGHGGPGQRQLALGLGRHHDRRACASTPAPARRWSSPRSRLPAPTPRPRPPPPSPS